MDQSVAILGHVALAFLLAVAGSAVSVLVGISHQRLCALISLAAGTLLGVTIFTILPEAAQSMSWWKLSLALVSGYFVFFFVSRYVYHVCPACAASHFDEATTHRFSEIASALIIALGLHSTLDGLALAAGHEAHRGASMVLAICVHKVPEGLALGALLLGAGYRKVQVIAWVAAVEATTVLGGLAGILWLQPGFWLDVVLAHAGGGFVFLAAHAVLGEMVKHGKTIVLTNFAVGVVLIGVLNLAVRTW